LFNCLRALLYRILQYSSPFSQEIDFKKKRKTKKFCNKPGLLLRIKETLNQFQLHQLVESADCSDWKFSID
jgi:hypothetical protein